MTKLQETLQQTFKFAYVCVFSSVEFNVYFICFSLQVTLFFTVPPADDNLDGADMCSGMSCIQLQGGGAHTSDNEFVESEDLSDTDDEEEWATTGPPQVTRV